MTARFLSISKAAKILKVSPDTLRNWEKQGKLIPSRTYGGARRYSLDQLQKLSKEIHPISKPGGVLSVSKAAKELRISADTLRNWESRKIIEAVRTKGGARRFSRAEIKRLQNELGIELQLSPVVTQIMPTVPKLQVPWLKLLTIGAFFTFVLALIYIAVTFSDQLKKINVEEQTKGVLGEYTQDLQSQIGQLVGIVETMQKDLYNIQSAQLDQITYIYPTESLQPVNLGTEAKTYQVIGELNSDIIPKITNKYNLGSLENTINQGFINNIRGKEASYELVKTSNLEVSNLGLNGAQIFVADGSPANGLGSSGNLYLRKNSESLESSLYFKAGNSWQAFNSQNLQSVYDIDSSIITLDSRDIKITLADTINDASFNITMSGENSFKVSDNGTFGDSTPFIVDSGGNVGIGEDQPVTKVHIVDDQTVTSAGITIENNNSTPDLDLFRIISDVGGVDNVKARITSSGDLFLDGLLGSGSADLAEEYNVLDDSEEGDLVVSDGGVEVIKSFQAYQQGILGVISKQPAIILGMIQENTFDIVFNPKPVALSGRVMVKVSTENGSIEVGDYLTSSSTPGVGMKATRPGSVVGKALEEFTGDSGQGTENTNTVTCNLQPETCPQGKIMIFLNISFADPKNALANLILDEEGGLVIPKIKTTSLRLGPINNEVYLGISQSQQSNRQIANANIPIYVDSIPVDMASKLQTIDDKLDSLESSVATQSAQLASQQSALDALKAQLEQNTSEVKSSNSSEVNLGLTPPEELLATGSATLADLKVTNTLSSDTLITALDATISGVFKALGNSFLSNTTIAGDLVVDGTFSISQNSLNALTTLYIQSNPMAEVVDFFNGQVTIDNEGNLIAQTITVAEFKVSANKISGNGQIKAGTKSVEIKNTLVNTNSRILITPTSDTNLVIAVTNKTPGQNFTVSIPSQTSTDINFDWWMVNEVNILD